MAQDPKIDSKWVPKSMIFVIFLDIFLSLFMFNSVSRPGRLLFSLVVKGSNNNKKKTRQGNTREDPSPDKPLARPDRTEQDR